MMDSQSASCSTHSPSYHISSPDTNIHPPPTYPTTQNNSDDEEDIKSDHGAGIESSGATSKLPGGNKRKTSEVWKWATKHEFINECGRRIVLLFATYTNLKCLLMRRGMEQPALEII